MSKSSFYLCLHGHFYQPPRENPWLEEIEEQPSARPYHDWNERIHEECYLANGMARVLDAQGKIVDVVNNYEGISFNFGPTLFSWIEKKYPKTYQLILEADQASRKSRQGHGNAIAQVYNHMIMPLASGRDKRTQVKWGMADFRHRFGREPESMWLSETACNDETLEVLMEEGLRFLILDPSQAESIRPLEGSDWHNVADGRIDPKQVYRYFSKSNSGKFIDIFFYDGPLSRDVSFGDLLTDAKYFADRLDKAKADHPGPQLLHLASDGETYGHHKIFGDRVLAYLLNVEAPHRGYHAVNYAEYLDRFPPRYEVRLKAGEEGLGTSWSCPHGVKRWKEHCGCHTGGVDNWTQHWRRPLRESLDWLRDELVKIYEEQGGRYFKDIWAARDDYISVVLNRSHESIRAYFSRHAQEPLGRQETIRCLKLLEMQRHAMLMYTSCGWFFTEISGIETVQIISYAARAMELGFEFTGQSLEEEFLKRLAQAKSNVPELKDGRGVYEKLVRPAMVSLSMIASLYGIGSTVDEFYDPDRPLSIYCFSIHPIQHHKESYGNITLNFGRVQVRSYITLEEQDFVFMVVHIGPYDFRSSVKAFEGFENLEALEREFFETLHTVDIVELLRKMDGYFGPRYFALKDLPLRERKRIIAILTRETLEKIGEVHGQLYEENRRMRQIYRTVHLKIPDEMCYAAEHTLSRRLMKAVSELALENFNLKKARPIYRILEDADAFGVQLRKDDLKNFLSAEISNRTRIILEGMDEEQVAACLSLMRITRKMGIDLDLRKAQDHLFDCVRSTGLSEGAARKFSKAALEDLLQLADELGIQKAAFAGKLRAIGYAEVP